MANAKFNGHQLDIIQFDDATFSEWKKYSKNGALFAIGNHINMQETGEWKKNKEKFA